MHAALGLQHPQILMAPLGCAAMVSTRAGPCRARDLQASRSNRDHAAVARKSMHSYSPAPPPQQNVLTSSRPARPDRTQCEVVSGDAEEHGITLHRRTFSADMGGACRPALPQAAQHRRVDHCIIRASLVRELDAKIRVTELTRDDADALAVRRFLAASDLRIVDQHYRMMSARFATARRRRGSPFIS